MNTIRSLKKEISAHSGRIFYITKNYLKLILMWLVLLPEQGN
jgi:hypothetical protein